MIIEKKTKGKNRYVFEHAFMENRAFLLMFCVQEVELFSLDFIWRKFELFYDGIGRKELEMRVMRK